MRFATLSVVLASLWYGKALVAFAAPDLFSSGSGADVVDTGYAKYRGNRAHSNTIAYLGIPYAEPPLGDRRFRAPLPLNTARIRSEAKGKVVDASAYPNFCIQGTTGGQFYRITQGIRLICALKVVMQAALEVRIASKSTFTRQLELPSAAIVCRCNSTIVYTLMSIFSPGFGLHPWWWLHLRQPCQLAFRALD